MKLTVYGSNLCPATMRFLSILTENHVMPNFVNVTGSIGLLKEFMTFRDTSNLYDGIRGSGAIGFPLIQLEDGTYTRNVNEVLRQLGIQTDFSFE